MANPTVSLSTGEDLQGEAVVLGCFAKAEPEAGRLQRRLTTALHQIGDRPGWRGLEKQVARVTTGGPKPVPVEVHGLGRQASFDGRALEQWLDRALRAARREGRREITLVLPDHPAAKDSRALRVLNQLLTSGYDYRRFKSGSARPSLRKVHLVVPQGQDEVYGEALRQARPVSRAIRFARDLGNTPPNEATPEWMAAAATEMAAKRDIACEVLLPDRMAELGMGGILAVGAGSAHPPRLVRLEWGEGDESVSFVGKGVTFDTGGISIKPSAAMEEMKYDKCGACTVMGIVQAVRDLQLPGRFQAYLPLAENMPGGASYRPSDIVRCYNGKTVEILDTDAEGRMILADALSWAASEKPGTLLEMSTLTGASVVALGAAGAALYTPDEGLSEELLLASAESGERLWRMPLWPDFVEEMKGVHADLRNLGSRWGGANSAAAFLGQFTGRVRRWAHLDIAGTAYRASREGKLSEATGFGVALIVEWLLNRTARF